MTEPRDAAYWARPVDRLHVGDVDHGAARGNVEGRRVTGPLQGFGQMWQKTYRVAVPGPTPEEVVATWKQRYGEFWPSFNRFYPPAGGIAPGEVAVISGGRGPAKVSTGVLVMYADDTSFAYITPEGHPFAGIITFSAYGDDDGATKAQVELLIRSNDPLYEAAFKVFTGRMEDRIWRDTLRSLAAAFGSSSDVETKIVCVDKKRQWNRFGNIWSNSALRTLLRRDRRYRDPSPTP